MPIVTRSYSASTSAMCMRMHPWLAACPHGVVRVRAVQADRRRGGPDPAGARGFPAPGGMDESSAAHGESSRYHTGSFCLSLISYSPVGVGYAGWPIAIG